MTRRLPCPAAPGPLEGYAKRFGDLFGSLAQRRGFREYLAGLPAPRDQDGFRDELAGAGLPFVMALKPRGGNWTGGPVPRTPADAARDLAWGGPDDHGDWQPVTRTFRDGHTGPGTQPVPGWAAGDRTVPCAWWWPLPTPPPCRPRPPGT